MKEREKKHGHIEYIGLRGTTAAMTGYLTKLVDLGYSGVVWLGCSCRNYHARYSRSCQRPGKHARPAPQTRSLDTPLFCGLHVAC